jgi:hypothetical protein
MRGSIAPQEEIEPRFTRVKTEFGMSVAGHADLRKTRVDRSILCLSLAPP